MTTRYRLVLNRDVRTARMPGYETGALTIVTERAGTVVIKEAGSKHWQAHFSPPAYSPARYRVFRLDERIVGLLDDWWATELVEFPVRGG